MKKTGTSKNHRKTKSGQWVVVSRKPHKSGDTHWVLRVSSGGYKTIKSGNTSNTAIDAAMSKYDHALRRLADR